MKKTTILILLLAIVACGCSLKNPGASKKVISIDEAKVKTEKFITDNLLASGKTATVKEIIEEGGLYKMKIDIGSGTDINSYLTLDGEKFFPQAMNIVEVEKEAQASAQSNQQQPAASVSAKSDKPAVEVFVMSYCPYGTQIEKGIIPVAEALGDKIDFQVKFCDYAMHGKKELDENLTQYCIQKEESEKFLGYLDCFVINGEDGGCLNKSGINNSKISACVAAADKEFKVTEKYNDKSTWSGGSYPTFDVDKSDANKYGITGSPGLVINGEKISSGRDSASLLKAVCSAFNNQPEECGTVLSSTAPSAGFGEGAGASSSGGCGG